MTIYFCDEDKNNFELFGTGQLLIHCNQDHDQARILFYAQDGTFLLLQIINSRLKACIINKNMVEWKGNNYMNKHNPNKIYKFRALFEPLKANDNNKIDIAKQFALSYNQCLTKYNNNNHLKDDYDNICIQVEMKDEEQVRHRIDPMEEKVIEDMNNITGMNTAAQTSKWYFTLKYEQFIVSLSDKFRSNLYESDIIPRCAPPGIYLVYCFVFLLWIFTVLNVI